METKRVKGLKQLRKEKSKEPMYHCENCGCKRYSPCYCMEKKSKGKKK